MTETSADFWENHYAGMTRPSGGRPSVALTRFAEGHAPGHALDLGCARGDDAIWLAKQGWTATGVDIAEAALVAAHEAAEKAGVVEQVRFLRHDLSETFPEGRFDLVSAMFLHSPTPFTRTTALKHAADAVAAGGLLLIVAHGSRAPWSWTDPETVYLTAQEELAALELDKAGWRDVFVGPLVRQAQGPNGQTAEVIDTVIALEKARTFPKSRSSG